MFNSVFLMVFTIILSPTEQIGLIGPRFDSMEACAASLEEGYNAIYKLAEANGFSGFSLNAHCIEHHAKTNGI